MGFRGIRSEVDWARGKGMMEGTRGDYDERG